MVAMGLAGTGMKLGLGKTGSSIPARHGKGRPLEAVGAASSRFRREALADEHNPAGLSPPDDSSLISSTAFGAVAWAGIAAQPGRSVSTFNWIIDDIVSWTGETIMCSPGGGGLQTAFGARAAGAPACLSCRVGKDFPDEHLRYVEHMGAELNAVIVPGAQTPRAWQLVEANGLRTQVWRTDAEQSQEMLALDVDLIPSRDLHGLHLATSPFDPPCSFISELRARGAALVGHEVYTHNTQPVPGADIRRLIGSADYFSPNVLEAQCLMASERADGSGSWCPPVDEGIYLREALQLIQRLSSTHGAQNILLRCGSLGALLMGKNLDIGSSTSVLHVPAYFSDVIDSTGCGNTFLGAFQASLMSTGDAAKALCVASAAAAVMGEHSGVPPLGAAEDMLRYQETVSQRSEQLLKKTVVHRGQPMTALL